jgi:hypothetical protein
MLYVYALILAALVLALIIGHPVVACLNVLWVSLVHFLTKPSNRSKT